MTEDEARKKWCPNVRFHVVGGDVWSNCFGNGKVTDTSANCIASDCMMWEWIISPDDEGYKSVDQTGDCGLKK